MPHFALRDGDVCTCDNDLQFAISYGQDGCGKTGSKWCNHLYENNYLYENTDHHLIGLLKLFYIL